MKQWLLTGYELLTVLAPGTAVYVLTRVRDKRCGQENGLSVWQMALLPAFCRKWDSVRCVAACGLLVSFVIELSQLLNNRRTDVDDLLLNALGAVLGLLLFRMVSYIFRRDTGRRNGCARDWMLCTAAAFVGRFLLFDELGAAGRLFGFYYLY